MANSNLDSTVTLGSDADVPSVLQQQEQNDEKKTESAPDEATSSLPLIPVLHSSKSTSFLSPIPPTKSTAIMTAPSHLHHLSTIERCGRDSLSLICAFLNMTEFCTIICVSQEWYHAAQLKSAWPQFDTSAYIRQLLTSPKANPSVRSLTLNIPVIGRRHLTDTNNEEYLTKRQEYQQMYRQAPEVEHYTPRGQADPELEALRKSHREWIIETQTKAGGEFIARCLEKSRIYAHATMIALRGCDTKSFDRITPYLPSLRALRVNASPAFISSPDQICEKVEVLQIDSMGLVSLVHFRSLRVLRTDRVKSVELIQLAQLEYFSIDNFRIDTARAVRYLSVKHQLRSLAIPMMHGSKYQEAMTRDEIKRAIDALSLTRWNDMREINISRRGPLDEPALDALPPATLTHLDAGLSDLHTATYLSFCSLISVRRFRGYCCSIGSLAHLAPVKRFLGQLEHMETESLHQVAIDKCVRLFRLTLKGEAELTTSLSHMTHLRELILDGQLKATSASATPAPLPNLLERLTISCSRNPTQLLDSIATLVAPLPHFHTLTFTQCTRDGKAPSLVISSHTLTSISQSSTWSTLQVAHHEFSSTDISKETQPDQGWNIQASQEKLNDPWMAMTLTDRVKQSFRLHLTQLELVYRIVTDKETGKCEWQLDNQ